MNLTTPDKIRNLQRKLNCKAKAEPTFRFYLLYDKICREEACRAYSKYFYEAVTSRQAISICGQTVNDMIATYGGD